jgi:hypothetical protein
MRLDEETCRTSSGTDGNHITGHINTFRTCGMVCMDGNAFQGRTKRFLWKLTWYGPILHVSCNLGPDKYNFNMKRIAKVQLIPFLGYRYVKD